ncbi:MAG: class I SAM-dependent methyltransferase [Clostridiales bacterium]|nr:class I SAM-dependent methyltransferase [Clostridiales bacterium]
MKLNLSPRLLALAGMALPGKPAADIGTDHGYLPAHLALNKICPFVIATDRAEGPLGAARSLVEFLCLESAVELRLGVGLRVLEPGEAATVFLSGLGGRNIMDILEASPAVWASAERLVLQPQKEAPALRRFFSKNGWRIVEEEIVREGGFFYEIMAAEKGEQALSEKEAEFGPLLPAKRHPLLPALLKDKKARAEESLRLASSTQGAQAKLRQAYLRNHLAMIYEVLRDIEQSSQF